jgi:hypothetical protein
MLSIRVLELLKILVGNFTVLKRLKEAKSDSMRCFLELLSRWLMLKSPHNINPLPLLFKSLLPGQEDCVFFSGNLNLHAKQESPTGKKIITINLKKTE